MIKAYVAAPLPVRPSQQRSRRLTGGNSRVMFVDLVGLTALASGRDPEELRELIQVYQNTVVGEITRFEGHIAKFLGDGVLASSAGRAPMKMRRNAASSWSRPTSAALEPA